MQMRKILISCHLKRYLVLAIAKKSLKIKYVFLNLKKMQNREKGVCRDIRMLKSKPLPRNLTKRSNSFTIMDCSIPR